MPYIKQEDRGYFEAVTKLAPENPGELNYVLTRIVNQYFADNGGRYQQINDVIGALEGAKMEFYRRIVVPYEDTKIAENGDV